MIKKELRKKQILADYKAVLSTDAGRRVFGGIFYTFRLNVKSLSLEPAQMAYENGMHDTVLGIANAVRGVDPRLVAECEVEYLEFLERSRENGDKRDV